MMLQAQIFINKDELKGSRPLYEWIMEFLISQDIKGATMFRGQLGFGHNHQLKNPDRWFSFDEPPAMILFIDEREKVLKTLSLLKKDMPKGLIVTSPVDKF